MVKEFAKNKITYDEIQKYYRSIVLERNNDTLMHPLPNIVKDSDKTSFIKSFWNRFPEMKYYQDQDMKYYQEQDVFTILYF